MSALVISVVGCGPTLPFEMCEGHHDGPPQFLPTYPLFTMKWLVHPIGVGISRILFRARQPWQHYRQIVCVCQTRSNAIHINNAFIMSSHGTADRQSLLTRFKY